MGAALPDAEALGILRHHAQITRCTTSISSNFPMLSYDCRKVEDFDLYKELYRGKTSLLYMAKDRRTGLQVALKLYRKRKLSLLNR